MRRTIALSLLFMLGSQPLGDAKLRQNPKLPIFKRQQQEALICMMAADQSCVARMACADTPAIGNKMTR